MAWAWWCVLAMGLLPPLLAGVAKAGSAYDNGRPRDFVASLEGFRKRAYGAHLNGFEAFPLFAAAVCAATLQAAPQGRIDALAIAYVAARISYVAAYLLDAPTLRSLLWTLALGLCIALFTTPIWG